MLSSTRSSRHRTEDELCIADVRGAVKASLCGARAPPPAQGSRGGGSSGRSVTITMPKMARGQVSRRREAPVSPSAPGKRDSINHHLLDVISETASVLELRQQLLITMMMMMMMIIIIIIITIITRIKHTWMVHRSMCLSVNDRTRGSR